MKKFLCAVFLVLCFAIYVFPQQPGWNVTLQPNTMARSNVEVINQCKRTHNFRVDFPNVPFLQPTAPTQLQVNGGKSVQLPVVFNTNGMVVGNYQGEVVVVCLTCNKEPTCTQDREKLPVNLMVANPQPNPNETPKPTPTTSTTPTNPIFTSTPNKTDKKTDILLVSEKPCDKLNREVEDLRQIAWEKEAAAAIAQDIADKLKQRADEAEKKAKEAENAAKKSDQAAQPAASGGTITAGGNTFTQADNDYLEAKKKKLFDDWKAGKITAEEHQRLRQELSGTDALKKAQAERLANEAKLKKDAEEAKRKAEAERKVADEAKAAAEAKKAADEAKKETEEARKKYEEELKKAEEECKRIEKERLAREAAARKSAEAAAQQKREDEIRLEQERKNKISQLEYQKYLIDNIKQLGLISHKGFVETPGIWDWLPAILEKPVGDLLEEAGKTPIPTDVLKAIGGLYNVLASLLDPCTQAGKRKTVERLQGMINPKTNRKYTLNEALDKTEGMCKLLRELKAKLEKIKQAQGK